VEEQEEDRGIGKEKEQRDENGREVEFWTLGSLFLLSSERRDRKETANSRN